jgi:hypothetical protein
MEEDGADDQPGDAGWVRASLMGWVVAVSSALPRIRHTLCLSYQMCASLLV